VQRASRGERVQLSRAERAEVVRRLTAAGLSAAQIADRLGIAQRSVSRLRRAA
jgi:DNA-binding CsgD family transcriptional regulator